MHGALVRDPRRVKASLYSRVRRGYEPRVLALRIDHAPSMEEIASALAARGRFWLDGDATHPEGRWAFLGAEPIESRRASFGERDALAIFDGIAAEAAPIGGDVEIDAAVVPRWVGYVAYDAAWSEARALGLRSDLVHARSDLPVAWLGRYERLIAIDLARGETYALAEHEAACEELARSVRRARAPRARVGPPVSEDPATHRAAIDRALEAIARGDIYQVNLARRWTASFDGEPLALWLAMREVSPVPLGMYLELRDHAVLARTMERFLRWERGTRELWTSPIKGTIARGGDDESEASALRADQKERAEHAMIVDLMRNDLSRVAEVGTVRVDAPLRVEPFAALHHLVSTVRCRTRAEIGLREILEATFPPGSITGTPKLAAMETIEREERCARGVYTGAVGFVDRAGGISLAVAIRTAVISGGEATYFAGGGLVSASDPDREIAETELKAKVFFDACERCRTKNDH
jgi:anthranilate/para-aminobenzoate synthase component I